MIVLRSVFKYTSILVVDVQVYIPTSSKWRSPSPISLLAFFVLVCLMIAILTAVKWTHKAVLICISLMAKVVEHFKNVNIWELLTFPPPVYLPPPSLSFVSIDRIRPWEGPIGHPFLSGFHSLVAIFFYCKVYQACLSCGYVNLCGDLLLLLTIASMYVYIYI